jgi:hypothetical protein
MNQLNLIIYVNHALSEYTYTLFFVYISLILYMYH